MLTVIGKERKRKNLTGIQGEFQRMDTLETKEKDKLVYSQRSKTVHLKSVIKKRINRKEMRLHLS